MPETVLIALITLASGFCGSLIGAVSSTEKTRMTIEAQRLDALRAAREKAYVQFMEAYLRLSGNISVTKIFHLERNEDRAAELELMEQLTAAYATALLYALPPVAQNLTALVSCVMDQAETREMPQDAAELFQSLVDAMRQDITSEPEL